MLPGFAKESANLFACYTRAVVSVHANTVMTCTGAGCKNEARTSIDLSRNSDMNELTSFRVTSGPCGRLRKLRVAPDLAAHYKPLLQPEQSGSLHCALPAEGQQVCVCRYVLHPEAVAATVIRRQPAAAVEETLQRNAAATVLRPSVAGGCGQPVSISTTKTRRQHYQEPRANRHGCTG